MHFLERGIEELSANEAEQSSNIEPPATAIAIMIDSGESAPNKKGSGSTRDDELYIGRNDPDLFQLGFESAKRKEESGESDAAKTQEEGQVLVWLQHGIGVGLLFADIFPFLFQDVFVPLCQPAIGVEIRDSRDLHGLSRFVRRFVVELVESVTEIRIQLWFRHWVTKMMGHSGSLYVVVKWFGATPKPLSVEVFEIVLVVILSVC